VETHGKIPKNQVVAIIPARHSSVRLPGKLLLEAGGKPLILHTFERVRSASLPDRVIVAVDSDELFRVVTEAGGEAVMTSADHQSGSDRIAEVAAGILGDPVIVNVQGDEPMISPSVIDSAVRALLEDPGADISTTCERMESAEDVLNPDAVKVVAGPGGYAMYFSRSPVPYPRDACRKWGDLGTALIEEPGLVSAFRKHTGLYVFRKEALIRFSSLEPTPAEKSEMLEQLRALENGMRIKVVEVAERSLGIDTEADLAAFREHVALMAGEPAGW